MRRLLHAWQRSCAAAAEARLVDEVPALTRFTSRALCGSGPCHQWDFAAAAEQSCCSSSQPAGGGVARPDQRELETRRRWIGSRSRPGARGFISLEQHNPPQQEALKQQEQAHSAPCSRAHTHASLSHVQQDRVNRRRCWEERQQHQGPLSISSAIPCWPHSAPLASPLQISATPAQLRCHSSSGTGAGTLRLPLATLRDLSGPWQLPHLPLQAWWPAQAAPQLPAAAAAARQASTLTKPGVPKPRPEVEEAGSTYHGGHVARLIYNTQTLRELEQTIVDNEVSLGNLHWAAAALQLERLYRQERTLPHALRVKSIAQRIEAAGVKYAHRMAVLHLAPLIRGLTGASHAVHPASLDALAAVAVANECAQLKLSSDTQWKHLVWGFSMQGYDKAVFWERLATEAIPLIPRWDANRVASVVKNLTMVGVRDPELMRAAMERLVEQAHTLKPYPLADALYALAQYSLGPRYPTPAPGPAAAAPPPPPGDAALRARFLEALTQRGLERLHAADAKCTALFLFSLARLRAGAQDVAAQAVAAARLVAPPAQAQAEPLHPIYGQKLLQACVSMGYRSASVAAAVAARSLPLLAAADPELRQRLRQALLDAAGAGAGAGGGTVAGAGGGGGAGPPGEMAGLPGEVVRVLQAIDELGQAPAQ